MHSQRSVSQARSSFSIVPVLFQVISLFGFFSRAAASSDGPGQQAAPHGQEHAALRVRDVRQDVLQGGAPRPAQAGAQRRAAVQVQHVRQDLPPVGRPPQPQADPRGDEEFSV